MKIPTMLLHRILLDVGLQVSDTVERDYREICSRYEREGESFLTITLPSLDSALLKGLSTGRLTRHDFEGFRPFRRGGSLPALLSGFFRRVFHDDGSVREDPCTDAIFAIRQVSLAFKKVQRSCTEKRIKAAYDRYVQTDREVDWRVHRNPFDARLWASVCGYLWSDLERLSGELYCFPGIFGSGATAERLKRNARYSVKQWPERSEGSFPSSFHAVAREDSVALQQLEFIGRDQELPVRVVQVPKTLKTPRTISVEPSYMMLMQQSIAKPLMDYLEQGTPYKGIHFTDQTVNQFRAYEGSVSGRWATIDLKDASDRVDLELIRSMFSRCAPTFLSFIEDCRSTHARLPDGSVVTLRKFASMGSALCFPIEAMAFYTIVMYSMCRQAGMRPSRKTLISLSESLLVYGDDIIVPTEMAPEVIRDLEDFGLLVNRDKSFLTGSFRESCGGDYYAGVNVTPVYVRRWDDSGILSRASDRLAYISLSNQLYMKGMWHACQYVRDYIDSRSRKPLPRSVVPIGIEHYSSVSFSTQLVWHRKLSGYRVKGKRYRPVEVDDCPTNVDGYLLAAFSQRDQQSRRNKLLEGIQRRFGSDSVLRTDESWWSRSRLYLDLWHCQRLSGTVRRLHQCDDRSNPPFWAEASVSRHVEFFERLQLQLVGLSDRLGHLDIQTAASLEMSDRPHALSSKRGWTTSPVGITW